MEILKLVLVAQLCDGRHRARYGFTRGIHPQLLVLQIHISTVFQEDAPWLQGCVSCAIGCRSMPGQTIFRITFGMTHSPVTIAATRQRWTGSKRLFNIIISVSSLSAVYRISPKCSSHFCLPHQRNQGYRGNLCHVINVILAFSLTAFRPGSPSQRFQYLLPGGSGPQQCRRVVLERFMFWR